MNSDKRTFKRIAAFVAAVSFLSVSNYGALNEIAADAASKKIQAEDSATAAETATEAATEPATSASTTPAATSAATTTAQTTTAATTTTVTTTAPKQEYSFTVEVKTSGISKEEKVRILDGFVNKINGAEVRKSIKSCNRNEEKIEIKYDAYPSAQSTDLAAITAAINAIAVDQEENSKCYACTIDCAKGEITAVTYYKINKCNALEDFDIAAANLKNVGNNTYVKSGVTLSGSCFKLKKGYYLEAENNVSMTVDNEIVLSDDAISRKKGDKEEKLFSIRKSRLTLKFTRNDIEIFKAYTPEKLNDDFTIDWTEIDSYQIAFVNYSCKFATINNKLTALDNNYRVFKVRELLEYIGDEETDYVDYENGKELPITVTAVPPQIQAQCSYIDGSEEPETKDVLYDIKDNRINIPLMIKKDSKDYYLSKYHFKVKGDIYEETRELSINDIYDRLKNEKFYYDSIEYSKYAHPVRTIEVEYTPFEVADTFTRESVLGSLTNRRSDGVFSYKSAPLIEMTFEEDSDVIGKRFILVTDALKTVIQDVNTNLLSIKMPKAEKYRFLEFISLFDPGENGDPADLRSIYFGDPFFIYFDETAPKIDNLAAAEKYKDKDGWSNDKNSAGCGQYTFTFDVSDDDEAMAGFEGMTDELKEKYAKINENPDLCSVSSVTVGGIVFEKPEGGWSSVSSISPSSVPEDEKYTAVLVPVKNEEGVFEGRFTAQLTLLSSVDGFDGDVVVTAVDNCGNDSAEDKEKQTKIRVKIDTCAPTAEEIDIQDLVDGIAGKKVLRSGNDLTVKATVNDDSLSKVSSGIVSTEISYADKKAGGSNVTFDVKNDNAQSLVTVTLTDKAGNTKTYYYSAITGSNVTDVQSKAAYIITDNTPPEKPSIKELAAPAFEDGDKKWYSSYQDVIFTVKDQGAACSEIRALSLRMNNADVSTVDIRKELAKFDLTDAQITALLSDTGMYITFVPEKTDDQQFIPYLCSDEYGVKIPLSDAPLSLDKGKLKAEISVTDYAGNVSDRGVVRIFIDNNAPVVGGTFSSDDAHYTKFGTFFNKQTVIKVPISDDSEGTPSSGWDRAVLKFATVSYEADRIEDNCAYFTVPTAVIEETSKPISGRFDITVSDKVGNTTTFEGLASREQITDAVFERIKPVIPDMPVITGDNKYVNDKGEMWYSSDASVRYDVSDPDSGLASAKLERSHEEHDPDSVKEENYSQLDEMTVGDVFEMSTDSARDGKFTFTMSASDNAGNLERKQTDVYKDVNAPYISGFNFEWEQQYSEGTSELFNIVMKMAERYGHFFLQDTVMTIYAKDDRGASAGIKAICFAFYDSKGNMIGENFVTDLHFESGVYSCTVKIPEGFKGDIKAWAVDNVENRSEDSVPDGIVIENNDRHKQTSDGKIAIPSTDHRDVEGLPLYNRDITADILVEDEYSGIRKIDLMTSDIDGTRTVEVNGNGDLEGGDGWNVTAKERNLATAIARSIGVTKNANNNYIRVAFTDNSGNITEQEIRFSIDKKKPVITVTGIEPSSVKKYYNTDKTAVVTIAERNFRAPEVNGSADGGFTADTNSVPGTDEYKHTKTFVFNTDGTYHLDIANTDLAGNEADRFTSGEFVIDKTAPVLNVEFVKAGGGTMSASDSYVNGTVKANISVEELNFDSGSVSIKINGKDYTPTSWSGTGSTHSAEIPASLFGDDGEYTVTISGSDLAGNSFRTYTRSFVIDTEKPSVEITGFSAANKGDVAPVVNISDKNLDEHEIKLYRNGELCPMTFDRGNNIYKFDVGGGKYLTGTLTTVTLDSGSGRKFVFDNFPKEECFDGSYRLEASAKDMAANGYSIDREFSVNRFGSVFTVDDIDDINGKYLAQARDIVIRERNVDLHDDKEDIIVIVDKGSATVKLDAGRYSISSAAPLKDGSGYEYVYTVFADNFDQDVDYRISIQSVDEAGNTNVSTGRGAEFSFNIDTHDPEFKCDDLIDSAEFRESGKTFKLNVNEALQSIKVTTGDGEVLLDLEGEALAEYENSFTFTVSAMNKSRSVTVEIVDLAGRKTTKTFKDILITENVALFLLHKPWVKVAGGSAVGGAGILGGLAVFLKKKKKKKLF